MYAACKERCRCLFLTPITRSDLPIAPLQTRPHSHAHTHTQSHACSCFADLALTSPVEYYKEGSGSLMQCVITPAAPYMPWTNEQIAAETDRQVRPVGCLYCY